MEQPNHKQCATCEVKADTGIKLLRCSGPCVLHKKPYYCSEQCQNSNWKRHKPFCRPPIHSKECNDSGGVRWVGGIKEDAPLRVPIICGPTPCIFQPNVASDYDISKFEPLPKFDQEIIEIKKSQTGGLGVFACRDIKSGDLLVAERPLVVNPMADISSFDLSTGLSLCDGPDTKLEKALSGMTPENKRLYLSLANSHEKDRFGKLFGILRTNGFEIELPFSRESVKCKYSMVGNKASRFNHSCTPNATFGFAPDSCSIQFHALKNIKKGEEIFCSYTGLYQTAKKRQAKLSSYGFKCTCRPCALATPASDRFRESVGMEIIKFHEDCKCNNDSPANLLARGLELQKKMQEEGLDDMDGPYFVLRSNIGVLYGLHSKWHTLKKYTNDCDTWVSRSKVIQTFLSSSSGNW